MTKVTIICGDVTKLPIKGKFHAILCDPPYELGFMGKKWDGTGVAYSSDVWAALLDHLHPGGFGMAFGGSRTYHRLACAIEDAGAVLHPMVGWVFGSGFPKSTRVKNVLQFSGHRYGRQALKPAIEPICVFQRPYEGRPIDCIVETGAGTLWIDGTRVGTETITTRGGARKDNGVYNSTAGCLDSKHQGRWPANLVLQHNPGCECAAVTRVKGIGGGDATGPYKSKRTWNASQTAGGPSVHYTNETIANWDCVEGCAVRKLGEQSGERISGRGRKGEIGKRCYLSAAKSNSLSGDRGGPGLDGLHYDPERDDWYTLTITRPDTGTAARFFTQVSWQLDRAEPAFCLVCLQPVLRHGRMSETQKENMPCSQKSASGAESNLRQNIDNNDFAQISVQQLGQQKNGGKSAKSAMFASSAEKNSRIMQEIIECSVRKPAKLTLTEKCVLSVRCVENLCDSCATVIAQSLAQMLQEHAQEEHLFQDSIIEPKLQTLIRNLAHYVASLDKSDTIQIIQNQNMLNGFVIHAIATYINRLKPDQTVSTFHEPISKKLNEANPTFYKAKAGRKERDAGLDEMQLLSRPTMGSDIGGQPNQQRANNRNFHPTVKPIELTKHLATLLLPPPEYAPRRLLIPFGGVASEAIGALLAGWDEIIIIEQSLDYCEIAKERVKWWQAQMQEIDSSDPSTILKACGKAKQLHL